MVQAACAEAEVPVPGFGVADDDELLSVPAAFDLDAVARHAGCGAGGSFSLALVPCYGESTPLGVHDKAPLSRVDVRTGDGADRHQGWEARGRSLRNLELCQGG